MGSQIGSLRCLGQREPPRTPGNGTIHWRVCGRRVGKPFGHVAAQVINAERVVVGSCNETAVARRAVEEADRTGVMLEENTVVEVVAVAGHDDAAPEPVEDVCLQPG